MRWKMFLNLLQNLVLLFTLASPYVPIGDAQEVLLPVCIQMDIQHQPTQKITIISNSKACITVTNTPLQFKFFLIEVHSQKNNVTLSETPIATPKDSITGTGIGLVAVLDILKSYTYWIINENKEEIQVQVTLVLYPDSAPIPGGCNMEFPVEISPFLRLAHKHGYTVLEFQHAFIDYGPGSLPPSCAASMNYIGYDIYVYFLKEHNFEEQEYFNGISAMQTTDSIKKNGKLVHPFETSPRTRVTFSSYPGQGVVYSIIAYYTKSNSSTIYESAYVPFATYSCSFTSEVDGCGHLTGSLAKVMVLGMAIVGLFVAMRGHRYLTIEMAYFGFLSSALISFILLTRFGDYSTGDRDIFTILCAISGAILWAGVWWFFGIPVISVLLVGFELGFLLTSVLYFSPLGNMPLLRNDFNFWMLLACGILTIPVFLLAATKFLNICGCAIVGTYAVIAAVDRYIGTSLSYIVLNTVKRAVVDDFYLASNEVPFQRNDIILCSIWGTFSIAMIILQHYTEKTRAPFPPAPFYERKRECESRNERREIRRQNSSRSSSRPGSVGFSESNERTPLLAASVATVYTRAALNDPRMRAAVENRDEV